MRIDCLMRRTNCPGDWCLLAGGQCLRFRIFGVRFLYFEGVVSLGYVAEYGYDSGSKCFRRCREEMAPFYEKFEEYIVQNDAHADQHCVAKQLYPAFEVGLCKHNVFRQCKA